MIKHKFLEEIGINNYPENNYGNIYSIKDWFRHLKYKITRKRTGIDPRDCWDLDTAFYQWLYEHLKQYILNANEIVDLDYNKFNYKDKEYTQKELIEYLCDKLKEMLLWDDFKGCPDLGGHEWIENPDGTKHLSYNNELRNEYRKQWEENNKKKEELKTEIFDVWKLLIDCMWW